MYITITRQTTDSNYAQSVSDFVAYFEKENEGKSLDEIEHFFNQYGEEISGKEVIQEIDGNTAKLKKTEPKFYSITVNPSSYELKRLQNHSDELKQYTRELMKDYAKSFHREIDGRPVNVDDIKYYAKVEHQRVFKGTDKQIIENQPFATNMMANVLFAECRNQAHKVTFISLLAEKICPTSIAYPLVVNTKHRKPFSTESR